MNIYFVRHGETDYNVAGMIQGGLDIPLNEKGIRQAEFLGQMCLEKSLTVDAIFTSPKKRAVVTADIVAQRLGMTSEVLDGLEEINLGDWQGLVWSEVKERYKETFDIWYRNRRYTKAPCGESYQEMLERVMRALRQVKDRGFEQVLIVTHNAVIMCLLCLINDTPFEKMTQYKATNGEIIRIDSSRLFLE